MNPPRNEAWIIPFFLDDICVIKVIRVVENLNLMTMERYKRVLERERKRMWRLGFFKWFGYVSLRLQDEANRLHLY